MASIPFYLSSHLKILKHFISKYYFYSPQFCGLPIFTVIEILILKAMLTGGFKEDDSLVILCNLTKMYHFFWILTYFSSHKGHNSKNSIMKLKLEPFIQLNKTSIN